MRPCRSGAGQVGSTAIRASTARQYTSVASTSLKVETMLTALSVTRKRRSDHRVPATSLTIQGCWTVTCARLSRRRSVALRSASGLRLHPVVPRVRIRPPIALTDVAQTPASVCGSSTCAANRTSSTRTGVPPWRRPLGAGAPPRRTARDIGSRPALYLPIAAVAAAWREPGRRLYALRTTKAFGLCLGRAPAWRPPRPSTSDCRWLVQSLGCL